MRSIEIPSGTKAFVGAPANPLPSGLRNAIRDQLAHCPGLLEAHLPQCYVPTLSETPAQVLVLVFDQRCPGENALGILMQRLSTVLPAGVYLDIWPMAEDHDFLPLIRSTLCRLL